LNIYSSSCIITSKFCCRIKPGNSNTTLYQGYDSRLLHLNSYFEFAFSIWHSFFLQFHCKLLVHLFVSPVYTSQGIINYAQGFLWHVGCYFIHTCLYSNWEILVGVTNWWTSWSAFKWLLVAMPFSSCSCNKLDLIVS
jgi:hypothetical protein